MRYVYLKESSPIVRSTYEPTERKPRSGASIFGSQLAKNAQNRPCEVRPGSRHQNTMQPPGKVNADSLFPLTFHIHNNAVKQPSHKVRSVAARDSPFRRHRTAATQTSGPALRGRSRHQYSSNLPHVLLTLCYFAAPIARKQGSTPPRSAGNGGWVQIPVRTTVRPTACRPYGEQKTR